MTILQTVEAYYYGTFECVTPNGIATKPRRTPTRLCPFCRHPLHKKACPPLRALLFDPPIDPLPTDAPGGDDEETGPYA